MAESKRAYRVEFGPVSGGWASGNNVVSCLCCMSIISTQGGGGEYLCDPCHDLMRRRKIFQILRLALEYGKDAETGLAEIARALKEYEEEHGRI